MATSKRPAAPSSFRAEQLSRYPADTQLIPLNLWSRRVTMPNGKTVAMGKAPLHGKWQKRLYDSAAVIKESLASKRNVGVRLKPGQLVADIDVRHGGDKGWRTLCFDLGIDPDEYPTVITGSGGRHVCMSIPPKTLVRDTLESDRYPGVEFKSVGRQVVAAGSKHPDGGLYKWDDSKPALDDGWPPAPTNLVNMIRRAPRSASAGGGEYDGEQLAKILGTMDPEDFREQDKWLRLMQACHHATGGEGREEFIAWSTSDPEFADHADVIGRRWDSMHAEKHDGVTVKTLLMYARKHGNNPDAIPAQGLDDDFDDDVTSIHGEPIEGESLDWLEGPKIPSMLFSKMKMNECLEHAERALMLRGAALYKMQGRLIMPVRLEGAFDNEDTIRRAAGALTVMDVTPLRLTQMMIEYVPFHRIIKPPKSKKIKVAWPPSESFAKHSLARPDQWPYPHLTGIIGTPTLRRDGSLLTDEGYDEASGLLLDTGGVTFPDVPDTPTKAEAMKALALLKKPLAGFPFVLDAADGKRSASKSVMLSTILTAVVRRSLPSAPMHGFSAPTPGTGKTLAVQVASLIATGHQITAMSQGPNAEEDEKRLFSVMMQGDPMLLIDNVTRPISGNALCTILTEQTWQSRVLGLSRLASVMTNILLNVSGNNLVFEGDMTRRALLCRMDAGIENPESRKFSFNPKEWVSANRAELVVAALTVLCAFVHAGRPGLSKLSPFGSFEAWSDLVRGALVWLDEADPCDTRKFIVADDPVKAQFGEFMRAARKVKGEGWFSAGDLIKAADIDDEDANALVDAIAAVAPKSDKTKLGFYLKARENQIVDGLHLHGQRDNHRNVNTYRILAK